MNQEIWLAEKLVAQQAEDGSEQKHLNDEFFPLVLGVAHVFKLKLKDVRSRI